MPFNPSNVKVAAGTLYAAPIGTTEPTSVSGTWPTGWEQIGYTEQGSEFDFGPTVTPINVEEEYYPVRQAITSYTGKLTFVMDELTQQNLALAMNAGIGSSLVASSQPTPPAGQFYQEPVNPGFEVRVMLGWGAEFEGQADEIPDAFQRFIWRQCLQVGSVKRVFRKGAAIANYAVEFALEKPGGVQAGLQPWRSIQPASLVS